MITNYLVVLVVVVAEAAVVIYTLNTNATGHHSLIATCLTSRLVVITNVMRLTDHDWLQCIHHVYWLGTVPRKSGFCPPTVPEDEDWDWDVEMFGRRNSSLHISTDLAEVLSEGHPGHIQVG